MISQEHFVAMNGFICPGCARQAIKGDEYDAHDVHVCQDVTCLRCGATWTAVYELVRYENFEVRK